LKTPYRAGTTPVIGEPPDNIAWSDWVAIDINQAAGLPPGTAARCREAAG
jgi:hypothetical protein